MIITALLNVIYNVLSALLVFNLPSLPDSILTVANQIIIYIGTGISIISAFLGPTTIAILCLLVQLVILHNSAYILWTFVFFVIRKIPMLNVRE